jgi:hypothetical protein
MDGVQVIETAGARVVIVQTITGDFVEHVRARLSEYCYGAAYSQEDSDYYSFQKTMDEFVKRFDPKPLKTKIGMAGELLVHVLMPLLHTDLISAAVFFNKEERSIKKGFDLTFSGIDGETIWYGEVKSGQVSKNQTADGKGTHLLETASRAIKSMLDDSAHLSRWESALIDVGMTLQSEEASSVKRLFRADSEALRTGAPILKRAVLAGAVMHEASHCSISPQGLAPAIDAIATDSTFEDVRILAIQQDTIESLIVELRKLAVA